MNCDNENGELDDLTLIHNVIGTDQKKHDPKVLPCVTLME